MNAVLNVALADAGISSWEFKYETRMWSPQTAIREADKDGNPGTQVDLTCRSLIVTPNHPTYVSGHSTFSSAEATVLSSFFGTDQVQFSLDSAGSTRSFDSLIAAAEEAGQSRKSKNSR